MIDTNCLRIKKYLEMTYDIPFLVEFRREYNDPLYKISPKNDMEELFDVTILYRQNLRLIIDIQPQKYAASLLEEMQIASINKKRLFLQYFNLFKDRNAKVEMFVNNQIRNPEDDSIWKEKWEKFRIRSTRIRICDSEQQDFFKISEIMEWVSLSVGMILSLLNVEFNNDEDNRYAEGKISQVLTNRYERNPINRELCLAANGYSCKVCGMDFYNLYGELGYHFIHVHHIELVSSYGGGYYLNPEVDLIPVCPNCHAMLHRVNPPMKPEDLKKIIKRNREQ